MSETIEWQLDAALDSVPFDGNATYQPVIGVSIGEFADFVICSSVTFLLHRLQTIIFNS